MTPEPTLHVRFYRTEAGTEPVRNWVLDLTDGDCRSVGIALNEIQFRWPIGMPRVRKLGSTDFSVGMFLPGQEHPS
jgi:hypothetical protein